MTNHTFRKKWGQNFLQDPNTIHKIIDQIEPQSDDVIIEIGPGQGALTFELAKKVNKIYAIEIDPFLVKYLNEFSIPNLKIINNDILDYDLNQFEKNIKVIGNLPYNISSPVIFKFLNWNGWSKIIFMTQKEVAERITSLHGNKKYGRLSVMAQVLSNVEILFDVPNTVFYPKPNVNSSILKFEPNKIKINNVDFFSKIVKQSFSQRRKILRNSLKQFFTEDELNNFSEKRPEQLSIQNFISISNNK